MQTTELTKEKMDVMKELAATNIKISEAKNLLTKLREDETVYLEGREKRAMEAVDRVLEDSEKLLSEAKGNHAEVSTFCKEINGFMDFVKEAHVKLGALVSDFNEKGIIWDEKVARIQEELDEQRKKILIDRTIIDNAKKDIEATKIKMKEEQKLINDQRGTVERAIKRLREGKI